MSHTLAKLQESYLNIDIIEMCKESLQTLVDLGLVLQTKSPADDAVMHNLEVTKLGRATFKGLLGLIFTGTVSPVADLLLSHSKLSSVYSLFLTMAGFFVIKCFLAVFRSQKFLR